VRVRERRPGPRLIRLKGREGGGGAAPALR
jgi:hypothetical protein